MARAEASILIHGKEIDLKKEKIMIKRAIWVYFIIFLASCSNPMNKKLTKENYKEVLEEVRKGGRREEFEQVQSLMVVLKMQEVFTKQSVGETLEGRTFSEIIENIKDNAEKSRNRRYKAEIEESGKEKLRKSYLVAVAK